MRDPHDRPRRRSRPLQLERLDARALLSTLAPSGGDAPKTTASMTMTTTSASLGGTAEAAALSATLKGDYHTDRTLTSADTGVGYHVYASGQVSGVGKTVVTGTLHGVGNIARGHATGTLRVSVPGGTLFLNLTGPEQTGSSPMPGQFNYTVTRGLGHFQGATGSGVATVNLMTPKLPTAHGQGQSVITLLPTPGTWKV